MNRVVVWWRDNWWRDEGYAWRGIVFYLGMIVFAVTIFCDKHVYNKPSPPPAEAIAAAKSKGQLLVWCNHAAKLYEYKRGQWYPSSADGEYLPEGDAIKAGYSPYAVAASAATGSAAKSR